MKHVLVCKWNARVVNEGTSQLKARGGISKFSQLLACVRIDTEHPRVGDDGATIRNQAPLVLETIAQVAQIQPRHTGATDGSALTCEMHTEWQIGTVSLVTSGVGS